MAVKAVEAVGCRGRGGHSGIPTFLSGLESEEVLKRANP